MSTKLSDLVIFLLGAGVALGCLAMLGNHGQHEPLGGLVVGLILGAFMALYGLSGLVRG